MLLLLKDLVRADTLYRGATQTTLRGAIARLQPPACIAVYGGWGSGKTTLVRGTWSACKEGQSTVWYDPWEHEQHGDVLSALLNAIVQEIERNQTIEIGRVKRLAFGLAKSMATIGLRLGAHHLFGADADDWKALSDLKWEDVAHGFESWSKYQSLATQIRDDFRELVSELASPPKPPLVVFVDDLDRCLPDSVVTVLESIKLLLCGGEGTNVVFVCALDRQIVGEAIAKRYPSSSRYSGESYLEKIFDLSLEIPPVEEEAARRFIHSQWLPDDDQPARLFQPVGGIKGIADVVAKPVFANPRVIKRVINRLMLLLGNEAVCNELELWKKADARSISRFLAWVAGAERFRAFRGAFMEATGSELKALYERQAGGVAVDSRLGPLLSRVADTPGFNQYYSSLGLEGLPAQALVTQQARATGGTPTLRSFDDLMRSLGL